MNNLRTLRNLAEYLLCYDAVTFLSYLESLRAGESVNSVWLFQEAAHTIFDQVSWSNIAQIFVHFCIRLFFWESHMISKYTSDRN